MTRTIEIITESDTGRVVEIAATEGAKLLDLCTAHGAPIPFSCQSASCGTCRVHVLAGGEGLVPPADDELDLLDVFNHDPRAFRLACQVRLQAGADRVHVKALQEE